MAQSFAAIRDNGWKERMVMRDSYPGVRIVCSSGGRVCGPCLCCHTWERSSSSSSLRPTHLQVRGCNDRQTDVQFIMQSMVINSSHDAVIGKGFRVMGETASEAGKNKKRKEIIIENISVCLWPHVNDDSYLSR